MGHPAEHGEDLLLAHVAVVDVGLQALAGVVDEGAVAGAEEAEVGELDEALEGAAVIGEVRDGGGAGTEEGVAREDHAVLLQVVAEGIDAMAGCGEDLHGEAAVEADGCAILEGAYALGRQTPLEEGDAVGGNGDFRAEGVVQELEVAAVVSVMVGDGDEADLGALDRGEVATEHPAELVDGLAGVDGEHLAGAHQVDVGGAGVHGVLFWDLDGADVVADLHGATSS